jgi:hypothetical protein
MKEFKTFDDNVDWRTPIDYLEPEHETENDYREIALKFTKTISLALSYIQSQRDTKLALFGVIFALGLSNLLEGKSMRTIATELDVTVASLSQQSRDARLYMGMEPSALQQPQARADKSRQSRLNKL